MHGAGLGAGRRPVSLHAHQDQCGEGFFPGQSVVGQRVDPTFTPCSTAATSASTPSTGSSSAPRLRADFSNGKQFYARDGQVIELPARRADRPGREFLDWHLDTIFMAS